MKATLEQARSMLVFAQVIEQGNFNAAAKQLGLTRAVVSYRVKKLESRLGIKLLNRSTRVLTLTEAGKIYYESCHIITEQMMMVQQKIDSLRSEPEGKLTITCPVNAGLQLIVPALNTFRNLYPKIQLDLQLTDDVVNIMQEGIDLAIRGAPLMDSGLQAKHLASLTTSLYGAPSYFRKHDRPKQPTDLNNHQWVIYKLGSNQLELTKGERSYSIKVEGAVSTNNAAARTAFVEGGHGLARIPDYDATPKVKSGTLEKILDDYALPSIEVYAVFPPGTASSKKLRLLLDFLQDYLRRIY